MSYRIEGARLTDTDSDEFSLDGHGGPYFEKHDDAVTYALEYARSVTGGETIEVERLRDRTVVTVRPAEVTPWMERLTILL